MVGLENGTFGKLLGREGRAFLSMVGVLITENPECSLAPSSM